MHKFLLTALAVGLASVGLTGAATAAQTFERVACAFPILSQRDRVGASRRGKI